MKRMVDYSAMIKEMLDDAEYEKKLSAVAAQNVYFVAITLTSTLALGSLTSVLLWL